MASEVQKAAAAPMVYFPHDADAANDIKCRRLIKRLGFDGYGRWWRLCELMASTTGHAVPVETDEDWEILGEVLGYGTGGAFDDELAAEDAKRFVSTLIDIGLLTRTQDGKVENSRMQNNAAYFGKQRVNGKRGGRPRKDAVTSKTTGQEL